MLTVAGDHVPGMPLVDVPGNIGAVVPAQKAGIWVNVGVTGWFTVMDIVVVVAHCPAFGVNVYVPEAVLLTVAGDHVPVIPLVDVPGNVGAVVPAQNGGICVNVGVTGWFTVMLIVVVVAHCPAFGVKVYVPEAVLLIVAGDHVPVIPLVEVPGNAGAVVPAQKAGICVKTGVLPGVTVMHCGWVYVQPKLSVTL